MDGGQGVRQLKEKVALACRVLAHLGLVEYLGHVSARVPGADRAVISPRGHALGGLYAFTATDMLLVDLEGRRIEGQHPLPSELHIHTEVLRARPEVQSVIHTHQPMAVAFTLAGRPLRATHHLGSEFFDGPAPVYDNPNLVNDARKGRRLAEALGHQKLLLLRGHGVVTAAASVEEATLAAIYLEEQAWHSYRAVQLGGLKEMSPEELAQHRADLAAAAQTATPVGPWLYYTSLLPSAGAATRRRGA